MTFMKLLKEYGLFFWLGFSLTHYADIGVGDLSFWIIAIPTGILYGWNVFGEK